MGRASNSVQAHERAVRIFVAAVLSLAVVLTTGPLTGPVNAQEGETEVALLNPSGTSSRGPGLVLSDRDMGSHGYHLVATVLRPPVDPSVAFEIQTAEDAEEEGTQSQPIGTAEQVTADTFQLFWAIPAELEAGDYVLRAIVFSGTGEVARDELEVEIDKEAPAVRLDEHRNGGALGFVQPRPEAPWATTLDFTFSQETNRVEAFYSLDRPGTEAEWTSCGDREVEVAEEEGSASSRLRCELDEADDPSQVTAVALVSQTCTLFCNNTILRTISNQSGDAHRVVPFRVT
ncbi:MAG: hypothetical protein ACRDI3_02515 [Actinomycetota bacterium]